MLGFLEKRSSEAEPFPGVVATPVVARVPQTWLLGSTARGAKLAGTLGLSFAYAHFINGDAPEVTAAYREAYRPSSVSQQPRVLITVAAFCSSDATERSDYVATLALRRARMRLEHDPLPPTREEARIHVPTIEERPHIEKTLRLAVAGHPASIREQLETLAALHGGRTHDRQRDTGRRKAAADRMSRLRPHGRSLGTVDSARTGWYRDL